MKRLPPHIAWPFFIIAILATGITSTVITVVAAHSDAGPQVVEDYYQKAAHWDDHMAQQAASEALGWTATVSVDAAEGNPKLRPVEVAIRDQEGQPVEGLNGTVRLRRPHLAQPVTAIPLAETADRPGVYRQQLPINATGLWDVDIEAARDAQRFGTTRRVEIR